KSLASVELEGELLKSQDKLNQHGSKIAELKKDLQILKSGLQEIQQGLTLMLEALVTQEEKVLAIKNFSLIKDQKVLDKFQSIISKHVYAIMYRLEEVSEGRKEFIDGSFYIFRVEYESEIIRYKTTIENIYGPKQENFS